ncbi:MAG: dTMP kinase [Planctomycetes bacterium]|jgi:dTMP kinase|nr:dTMP kinase [Planctomycetota bacterium]
MTSASWSTALRGRFLAFEGPDGSGKSTQIGRFQAWAEAQQLPLTLVREPGGTAVGERVRQILLDPIHSEMTVRCEMLLYMASRAQLMEERIEPAIASRACVLSDRFVGSTLAYQGAAGGIPERDIRAVAQVAIGGRWPDLNVLFDVDTETAMKRLNPLLDRMEGKGMDFHRRVRDGYLAEAHRDPKRHLVIDASRSPDEVFEQLINGLRRWSESFSPAVAG